MKTLNVTGPGDVKSKVEDVEIYGDPNGWVLLSKASSLKEGWMKSTKAMLVVGGGCLVQVSSQQRNPDGSWALAEALTYVHGASISSAGIFSTSVEGFEPAKGTPHSAPLIYDALTFYEEPICGSNDIELSRSQAEKDMI